jgi:phage FluMu protein Com
MRCRAIESSSLGSAGEAPTLTWRANQAESATWKRARSLLNCMASGGPTEASHLIETDVKSLSAAWKATLKVNCPLCSEVHNISVREAYINGALEEATKRLRA